MDEARVAFDRLKPTPPPEIVVPEGQHHRWGKMVRDVDNEPARGEDGYSFIDVFESKQVRAHIILNDIARNTKDGRQLRRIARLAEKFDKDHAAAVRASGFWEARSEMVGLRMELQEIGEAALAIKPSTMEGIAVYSAIVIAGAGPSYEDHRPGQYEVFGVAIAEALTRDQKRAAQ
jgi:hypothetical protein